MHFDFMDVIVETDPCFCIREVASEKNQNNVQFHRAADAVGFGHGDTGSRGRGRIG